MKSIPEQTGQPTPGGAALRAPLQPFSACLGLVDVREALASVSPWPPPGAGPAGAVTGFGGNGGPLLGFGGRFMEAS